MDLVLHKKNLCKQTISQLKSFFFTWSRAVRSLYMIYMMAAKLMLAILQLLEPRYNLWSQNWYHQPPLFPERKLFEQNSSFWILNLICLFKPFKVPPSPTHLTPCFEYQIKKSSVFCGWKYESVPTSILLSGFANLTASSRNITVRWWSSPNHRGLKKRWCIVYKKVEMRASLGLIGASYRWVVSGSRGRSWLLVDVGWLVGHGARFFALDFCVFLFAGRCVRFFFSEASRVSQRDGIRWLIPKNYINATSRMLRQLYKSNMLGAEKQILRWESLPAQKIPCIFFGVMH